MNETGQIMLCSDMDRTIIPNGKAAESPEARRILQKLAKRPELTVVYVTGRDTGLIAEAIHTWDLPLPDYAVGDVGTAIYTVGGTRENPEFAEWGDWQTEIGVDWDGWKCEDLAAMLSDFDMLTLQEPEKQKTFKLSYYLDQNPDANQDPDHDLEILAKRIGARLLEKGVRASVITSIDEMADTALLDILPERATKAHAIYFIMSKLKVPEARVVYAGDSGNDLPVLTSGLNAVIVKNAADDVVRQALSALSGKGRESCLYQAKGGFLGMNGNYSAGVLEGLAHFIPEAKKWMPAEVEIEAS